MPPLPSFLKNLSQPAADPPETSARLKLLDSFLRPSHGNLQGLRPIHQAALEKDPQLYGHLARWYADKGSLRDHHELFAAHMLASPHPEHRECGRVLLQPLRTYQVERVVRYAKEQMHRCTRALRSAVEFYLRRRENHPAWFDESVIRNKHAVKYLYATLHIRPDPRAEQIIFQQDPPPDSRVYMARQLWNLREQPDLQAELIIRERIHYTTAIGSVKHFTPAILFAFVSVMTPQQVINHMKFFERCGALTDQDMRAVIEQKLKRGATESRVSDFKAMIAMRQVQADADLARELIGLTTQRLRNRGAIEQPTALFVDKSGSMQEAIAVGKMLACMCSSICTSDLYVYAFDSVALPIRANGRDVGAWEEAFRLLRADGATSVGCPLQPLMDRRVEQIVIISDGEENTPPLFHKMLEGYEKRHQVECRLILIKVGGTSQTTLETSLKGRELTVIPFSGDYYNLPNVIPLLCSGGTTELLGEVLATPLYRRSDLDHLPPAYDEETHEIR